MVTTTSLTCTAEVVSSFGVVPAMSIPSSAIASTATGLTESAGAEPAESTSTRSPARCCGQPAAICERPALWTQTNRTVGLSLMASDLLGVVVEHADQPEGEHAP